MRRLICIVMAASIAVGQAAAQADRSGPTLAFFDMCVAEFATELTDPGPTCACGAGVLSGKMTDLEYEILGRILPVYDNEADLRDAISQMTDEEGYAFEDIQATAERMEEMDGDISRTCTVLER
ncbi:MAG: hypothetical protein ACK4M6_10835 [Hyphomonas sp.]